MGVEKLNNFNKENKENFKESVDKGKDLNGSKTKIEDEELKFGFSEGEQTILSKMEQEQRERKDVDNKFFREFFWKLKNMWKI